MARRAGRVMVTGVGAVTPLGPDAPSTWDAMLAGRCAVTALPDAWAAGLPVRIAARAARRDGVAAGQDLSSAFLLEALAEAWQDAGFAGPAGLGGTAAGARVAVCVGTGVGAAAAVIAAGELRRRHLAAGRQAPPAELAAARPDLMLSGAAMRAAAFTGAGAGVHGFGGACCAGADAIARGLELIRAGRAEVVAVGGTEAAVHPLSLAAFARLGALSRRNDEPGRASRPYDKSRDGFVLGEGAGVLVLESEEHASARGAVVYCELAGAGAGADARHPTQPDPQGDGMRRAIRAALTDARLAASSVAHVNAHATASSQGDVAESRALLSALGRRGYCVSATKSMTGHLLGAAGAVEAVAAVLAIRDRVAPPTINLDDLDDEIGLDVVRWGPRELPPGPVTVLSTSAAFGGHNVALALRAVRANPGRR